MLPLRRRAQGTGSARVAATTSSPEIATAAGATRPGRKGLEPYPPRTSCPWPCPCSARWRAGTASRARASSGRTAAAPAPRCCATCWPRARPWRRARACASRWSGCPRAAATARRAASASRRARSGRRPRRPRWRSWRTSAAAGFWMGTRSRGLAGCRPMSRTSCCRGSTRTSTPWARRSPRPAGCGPSPGASGGTWRRAAASGSSPRRCRRRPPPRPRRRLRLRPRRRSRRRRSSASWRSRSSRRRLWPSPTSARSGTSTERPRTGSCGCTRRCGRRSSRTSTASTWSSWAPAGRSTSGRRRACSSRGCP
mmetsp:Transcript_22937/g.71461  ORF Transcript_22937/g.71461 Transcript_22937/m.71461 type:complete len:311 (-) Transcript_22937:704-1636(-)